MRRNGGAGTPRIILFLGAPGSGKGTQSTLLAARLGIAGISTGEILRDEAKRNTPAGFRLRQTLATGALVADGIVCEAVSSRIVERDWTAGSLILDGFPRTVAQARILDGLLNTLPIAAPVVLHLDVPGEVLRRRLACRRQCATCGAIYNLAPELSGRERSGRGPRCQKDGGALVERDDDSEGVVARRLATYERETLPVLNYYRSGGGGGYRRVDGNRSAAEIADEVLEIVGAFDVTAVAA